MSTEVEMPAPERAKRGLFWAMVPVVLIVSSTVGISTIASIAIHDPGFALEKDYYDRAVHWDRQQAQWSENSRLGYRLTLELAGTDGGTEVAAHVVDRAGVPVRGAHVKVEAFANARASARHTLALAEQPDGSYAGRLAHPRPGLWEFRFTLEQGSDRFTAVERADVPAGPSR